MNHKKKLVLHIICPLVIGVWIYAVASPDVLFLKGILSYFDGSINLCAWWDDTVFFRFVRNYVPDMMWGYALVVSLHCIIGHCAADRWKAFWIAFPFSAAMEFMQKLSFVIGTFDVFDIFAELLAELSAVWMINKITCTQGRSFEK